MLYCNIVYLFDIEDCEVFYIFCDEELFWLGMVDCFFFWIGIWLFQWIQCLCCECCWIFIDLGDVFLFGEQCYCFVVELYVLMMFDMQCGMC